MIKIMILNAPSTDVTARILYEFIGKFHKFDLKIINFLKRRWAISCLILGVERSFNHQNDRRNVENTCVCFNNTSQRLN